jgi:hypothetical protein
MKNNYFKKLGRHCSLVLLVLSGWTGMAQCDPVSVPYEQDFESVVTPAMPACTTIVNAGSGNNWTTASATSGGFTSKTLRYTYNFASPANAWFFTRGINLTAGTSYRISYKYGATSTFYTEKLGVAYGTAATAAGMTNVLANHNAITNTTPITSDIDFTPATTGVYYFGFNAKSATNQNVLLVDDINITVTPTCLVPTAVVTTSISTTSIGLSWTASTSAPAGGYEYYYSSSNTKPTVATAGTPVPTGTSATINNLNPSSTYYFWVRSICSATDKSAWTEVKSGNTLCGVSAVPYVLDFEAVTTPALPLCTTAANEGEGDSTWRTSSPVNAGFTTKVLSYSYDWEYDANAWFITGAVNLTAGTSYRLSYKYGNSYSSYTESFLVAYGTSGQSSAMVNVLADHPEVTGAAPAVNAIDFTPAVSGTYYFGFQVYSIADQGSLYLDDISVKVTPSCFVPAAPVAVASTPTSMNISWSAPSTPATSGYEYYYSTSTTAPTAATTGTTVATGTTASVSSLSPNTTYNVWVRTLCSATDKSEWAGPVTATTPCVAVNAPLTEAFTTGAMPSCWTTTSSNPTVATGIWKFTGMINGSTGPLHPEGTFAWVDGSDPSDISDVTLLSPMMNLTTITNPQLVFEYYSNNSGTYDNNVLSVDVFNGTTWANVFSDNTSSEEWRTIEIPLTAFAGNTIQVRFVVDKSIAEEGNAYYNDIAIDNVKVRQAPTCLLPSAVQASATSATSAAISWTPSASTPAGGYEYYHSTTDTAPTAAATGTVVLTGTTATISSLTANTTYYVWVRALCSATDRSEWTAIAVSFTTPCVPVNAPFLEEFSTGVKPSCWTTTSSNPTVATGIWKFAGMINGTTGPLHPAGTFAWADGSDPSDISDVTLLSPMINLSGLTNPQLAFDFYSNNIGEDENNILSVDVFNGTVWTNIFMDNTSDEQWRTIEFSLASFAGNTIQLRFVMDKTAAAAGNAYYNDIAIDNVKVRQTPTCLKPTNVTAVSNTTTTVNLSWTAAVPAPANGYEYYYSTTNTAPAATATGTVVATGTTATISNLPSGTTQYIWVRSLCSATDKSDWTLSVNATTLCAPATVPYTENFDGVTTDGLPNCTVVVNDGEGNEWETSVPGEDGFDTTALTYSYDFNNPADTWFYTRELAFTAGVSYRVSYKYAVSSEDYEENFAVAYGPSAESSAMTILATHEGIVNTDPMVNTVDFTPTVTGVYRIGFHAYSEANQFDIYIDDISVTLSPSCIEPTALQYSAITASSVTLSWTAPAAAPAGGYAYYYSAVGVPPTATTAGTAVPTGTSVTIPALASDTEYSFWVRSICTATDSSAWSGPFTATTPCTATGVPYIEDFESATDPELPGCTVVVNNGEGSGWETMNPDYAGFTTNVLSYGYDFEYAADTWFFTRGLNLVAGTTYKLSYKYGASSEDYPENLRVAYGTSPTSAAMTSEMAVHEGFIGIVPFTNSVQFTPSTSGVYYIGFQAYSEANMDHIFVDDIMVDVALGTKGIDNASLSYYPNPVKDVLNLSFTTDITSIVIYNLLGQQVMAKDINAAKATVDMSALADGAYIVNVTAGSAIKTIKVIKKQ